jgi:ABC-type spermidine/putrescine transport system permease subunit I
MNKNYEQSSRFSAAGVTTAAILVVIIAMGVSVAADLLPGQPSLTSTAAIPDVPVRG